MRCDPKHMLAAAERCEREKPSRDLDGIIAQAVSLPGTVTWSNDAGWLINRRGAALTPIWERYYGLPAYSSAIDAAVALVPTKGFNAPWSWRVGNLVSGGGFALLGTSQREYVAATPALALCAACLRALAEIEAEERATQSPTARSG